MKPIIFAGDSWTFGEGLELYNDKFREFSENYCKTNNIDYNWPTVEDISEGGTAATYRLMNRFPTTVSNHFNTFYISSGINGGDNTYEITYIKPIIEKYGESNFSYIVLQFTDMFRDIESHFNKLIDKFNPGKRININTVRRFLNIWESWDYSMGPIAINHDVYKKLTEGGLPSMSFDMASLVQREYETYENFIHIAMKSQFDFYYELLSIYNIPIICIGTWSKDDSSIIKKLDIPSINFFKERLVTLENNGIETKYLADLIDFNSNEYPYDDMLVANVWEWTRNHHPTKKFHNIIADCIIKHIKNLESTT